MSTIIITGATDGIGYETAKQLLSPSNHLIVHARNERKAEKLVDSLRAVASSAPVTPVWADFSSMSEVHTLAGQIKALNLPVDCLINNAGIYSSDYIITAEHLELTMAVNYFAAYLLTRLLEEQFKSSGHARIPMQFSACRYGIYRDSDDARQASERVFD